MVFQNCEFANGCFLNGRYICLWAVCFFDLCYCCNMAEAAACCRRAHTELFSICRPLSAQPQVTGSFIQQRHTISRVGPTNCGCLASSNSTSSKNNPASLAHRANARARSLPCSHKLARARLRSSHFDEVKRSTSFAIKFKKVIAIESVRKA